MERKDFAEMLTDLRGGACHDELTTALADVARAVVKTGKMGTVQLTVKIKSIGERQVEVIDAVKVNVPEPTKPSTIMFAGDNYHLTRTDPRQASITDIKTVADTRAIKEVNNND